MTRDDGNSRSECSTKRDEVPQPGRLCGPAYPDDPQSQTPAGRRAAGSTSRILLTTDASAGFDQLTGVRAEVLKLP